MADQNKEYIPDLGKLNKLHRDLNRDMLHSMSLIDLLYRIHIGMISGARCSIEAITGRPYSCRKLSCYECMADWLNKQATTFEKEVDYNYENMSD